MTSDPDAQDIERLAATQVASEPLPASIVGRVAQKQGESVGYEVQPEALGAAVASCGVRAAASSAAVELGRRLLVAARAGDTHAVLQFLAKGAYFTSDWLGTSPLHLAAVNGHAETCAVLLRAGVSRDTRTKVDRTPLHLAAYSGHALVAKVLLDEGANVDCRDMLGMTPLHWAVERGHAAVASLLVARGADVRARSKFLKTPAGLAAARGHSRLQRALDDALKEREASASVQALVTEHLSGDTAETQVFETIEEGPVTPTKLPTNTKQTLEKNTKLESTNEAREGVGAEGVGAQLLRRHGITLLPADDGGTVLSALQSGRTVVLSDAGKLMLKESGEPTQNVPTKSTSQSKGVVLTATPVRSPPRAGVKVFTLNNRLLTVNNKGQAINTGKKVYNPQNMQVKYVQLPADAKIISPSKLAQNKAKTKIGARSDSSASRPVVKILMNKSNFNKLIATQSTGGDKHETTSNARNNNATIAVSSESSSGVVRTQSGDNVVVVPESFVRNAPAKYLRAQLATARLAIADLTAELAAARASLAKYERAE